MSDPDVAPTATTPATTRRPLAWFGAAIAIVFALFFAYDLFEAISNMVGVVTQLNAYNVFAAENDLNIQPIPWVILVVNLLVPPVAYAIAFILGRRHSIGTRTLVFLGGLAVVAALTLSLAAFV